MTLVLVSTGYTTGSTLKAWPDGSTSNGVLLAESPTGRYTGVLDDAFGNIWLAFVGASCTYDHTSRLLFVCWGEQDPVDPPYTYYPHIHVFQVAD